MGIAAVLLTTGAFKTAVWIFLLIQGLRLRLMRYYPLAYVYFFCLLATFWVKTAAVLYLGTGHPRYYWIYYGTTIPVDLLALLIVLRIYHLHQPPSLRRDWPLLAVVPVFIAMTFTTAGTVGFRAAYVISGCLVTTGGLAIFRNLFSPVLDVGENLYWLTFGITVPAGLQAFNQAFYFLGVDFWPYDAFWVVNELTTVFSWGMIAHGMIRYSPPRIKEPEETGDALTVEELKQLRKTLWRWR